MYPFYTNRHNQYLIFDHDEWKWWITIRTGNDLDGFVVGRDAPPKLYKVIG